MWVSAIGSGLKFLGGSLGAKKKAKQDAKNEKEKIMLESSESRRNSQFDAETAYYYKQLERAGKQRGLEQFRQFSTVKNFAPNYQDTSKPIEVPVQPVYNQGAYANPTGKK